MNNRSAVLPWFLVTIPVLFYFVLLTYQAQNIPHWDDYAILGTVNKLVYDTNLNILEKFKLFFVQHNEHRIAFTRFCAWLTTVIAGNLNFKWLIFIGSASLLFKTILFYKYQKANKLDSWYLLPVVFSLFSLAQYENSFWAMASIQNFWVVAFSLAAYWQLAKGKIPWLWYPLAAYTSANAVVLIPIVGFILFFFQKVSHQKILFFALLTLAIVLSYFITYIQPPDSQAIDLGNFLEKIKNFFVYLGSYADIHLGWPLARRSMLAILLALFFCVICLICLFKIFVTKATSLSPSLYFLLAIILFAMGTAAITALTRTQYGAYVFLVSRYKIMGVIAFISVYYLAITIFYNWRKIIVLLASIFSILAYIVHLYVQYPELDYYQKTEWAEAYNSWHNDTNNKVVYSSYVFPENFAFNNNRDKTYTIKVSDFRINDSYLYFENQLIPLVFGRKNEGTFLVVESELQKYIYPVKTMQSPSIQEFITKFGEIQRQGAHLNWSITNCKSGYYNAAIFQLKDNVLFSISNSVKIQIAPKTMPQKVQNW